MTDTVLLATNVQPAFRAALADRYETLGPLTQPFEPAASALSAAEAARVRAIVTMGSLVIPQASLDRFPALGLLACVGSGYEGMPVAAARRAASK
jgi:hydroxypyruvate reductase